MTNRSSIPLAALSLAGALACGGGGGGGTTVTAECDQPANVARRAALAAAQPAIGVRASSGKAARTFTTTFPSVAGNPTVSCPVQLQFKDSNGDAALQPYEDWTRPPAERAADLAARMTTAQKRALMAHAILADSPLPDASSPSAATNAVVDAGIRFGRTGANGAQAEPRAQWANAVQERCEGTPLGIPFVLSSGPAHSNGNGRAAAKNFSIWPGELGLAATGDLALVRRFGQTAAQEFHAVGVRIVFSPAANLATEPRWFGAQFGFGEDSATVSALVGAFVEGLQSTARGVPLVAAVVGDFPGAGAARGGFDPRLAKGKATSYPGNHFDAHVGAFQGALAAGAAGVMTGYGVPETGAWTGLSGLVNGATIEQVGASFSPTLVGTVLRGHYAFGGLVVAPEGVLDDATAPLGAPWGVEAISRAERVGRAVAAGVDQFVGLNDTAALDAAALTPTQVDAAARRALALSFGLGLFENPYVDPAQAPAQCNTDVAYQTGLDAMNRGMVLLFNRPKPAGWLNGGGDGTQSGDKGNAGNGTLRILPAPPGEPYVSAGCAYHVSGDFNLDYVRSVSNGYGFLTNDAILVTDSTTGVTVDVAYAASTLAITAPQVRMALADYVFVRVGAPYAYDPDSGALGQSVPSLTYAGTDPALLDPVAAASTAITSWNAGAEAHGLPRSNAQIVVIVDAGRPPVVSELFAYGISALYVDWMGAYAVNLLSDKVALDVAFGIVNGRGRLPVGLPASDAAAAAQQPDTAGDGQDATFIRGFGLDTNRF